MYHYLWEQAGISHSFMENCDMGEFDQTKVHYLLGGPEKIIILMIYDASCQHFVSFHSLFVPFIIFKVMIDIMIDICTCPEEERVFLLEQK